MHLIERDWLALANQRKKNPAHSTSVMMGVYVDPLEDKNTVIVIRKDNAILDYTIASNHSIIEASQVILRKFMEYGPRYSYVNTIGEIRGIVSLCEEKQLRLYSINLLGEPFNKKKYVDKRSECYFKMQEWLWNDALPHNDETFIDELFSIEYIFDEEGRAKVLPLDPIHHGITEALVLTFGATIARVF